MAKFADAHLVILSAAARREDGAALPPPKSLKIKGGVVTTTLQGLLKKGLLEEKPASREAVAWREAKDGRRMMLVITNAGLRALGIESDRQSTKQATATKPNLKKGAGRGKPTPVAPKVKGKKTPPAVRRGTKQALLIDLLKRKNGATIDEVVEATGWQPHSVRGAISGALKKKLGLTVESEKVAGRGRVYRIVANR